jgi:hypothetical protein
MSSLFEWLGTVLVAMWGGFRKFFLSLWSFIAVLVYLAWQGFNLLGDMMIQLGQKLVDVIATGTVAGSAPCGGGLTEVLAIANTFFPLDELLRMMAALMVGVWLPIGVYRIFRSLFPTIAGVGFPTQT